MGPRTPKAVQETLILKDGLCQRGPAVRPTDVQRTKRSPAVKKRISLSLTQSFPNTSSHNPLLAEGQHGSAKHSEKHTALPRAAQRSLIVSSASSELKITWKPHVNHLKLFITATS